jgi:hypothetical protein
VGSLPPSKPHRPDPALAHGIGVDATARYSLAVTCEVVNKAIKIYDDLIAAIHTLQQEIEAEAEVGEAES